MSATDATGLTQNEGNVAAGAAANATEPTPEKTNGDAAGSASSPDWGWVPNMNSYILVLPSYPIKPRLGYSRTSSLGQTLVWKN